MTKRTSGKKQKKLGYTELEWICPFCEGRNPGHVHKCGQCGAPQAGEVEFVQAAQEKLITDEERIDEIEASKAEIHCPFCNTRNSADATICIHCGGELVEGTKRQSGRVLGKHRKDAVPDITCPNCSTVNPGTARRCSSCFTALPRAQASSTPKRQPQRATQTNNRVGLYVLGGVLFVLLLCYFLFFRTTATIGTVQSVEWTRTVAIMGFAPVERSAWVDEIPSDALDVGNCQAEVRRISDAPEAGFQSEEVCGTPYTVDRGDGFGEVVQDCEYQIYDDFCEYTALQWGQVDAVSVTGNDFDVVWPSELELNLQGDQEVGDRSEEYVVLFRADGENFTYSTSSYERFLEIQEVDSWVLNVNNVGGVQSIEPNR